MIGQPLQLQAWGDESIRTVGVDRPSYLLGAVVCDSSATDTYREQLRHLRRGKSKLHWRDLGAKGRTQAIDVIANLNAYHVVVVAAPVDLRRQERARALCLERLAWELDSDGVELLTLEARPPNLMRRDRQLVDVLRTRQALPTGLRVQHGFPSEEPMLWIADQVLGALGESLAGGDGRWFEQLRSSTVLRQIDL